MREPELLSRASATIAAKGPQKFVLASAHVAHPFVFRKLYPGPQCDWLDFVKEEHVTFRYEIRSETGSLVESLQLSPFFVRHSSRDLICIIPKNDDEIVEFVARQSSIPIFDVSSFVSGQVGDQLQVIGCSMASSAGSSDDIQSPECVDSVLIGKSSSQVFIRPAKPLVQGMCGGAVVSINGGLHGILEGVVPDAQDSDNEVRKELSRCGVFVEAEHINTVIDEAINSV